MIKECRIQSRNSGKSTYAIKLAMELKGNYYSFIRVGDLQALVKFINTAKPFEAPIIIDEPFNLGPDCFSTYKNLYYELAYGNRFDFYLIGTPMKPWDFKKNHFHQRLLDLYPEQFI